MRCRNFMWGLGLLVFAADQLAAQPVEPMPAVTGETPAAIGFPGGILLDPNVAAASHEYYGPPQQVDAGLAALPPCNDCPCCHCAPCECPCEPAACLPCPRINLVNPCWQMLVGGQITLDMLFNSARPIAPGTPFFLKPDGPFDQDTFDIHARQTGMYFALVGPEMGNFRSGGLIVFNLYSDNVIVDRYGFLPYQGYGELRNEFWRFAAGLQADIFAPL